MEKTTLEAMLPEIQTRYTEVTDEAKKLEGEFRRVQQIIQIIEEETKEGEQAQKGTDATVKE